MLVLETIAKIRRAYFAQKKPICREFWLSRKVVRKVIRSGATEFRYERGRQPLPRSDRPRPRQHHSEKDGPAGSVRNHGTDPSRDPSLASRGRGQEWTAPLPEPLPGAAAPLDPAVCADRPCLGRECRAGQLGLRHAFDAANEGGPDLQEDGQP